MLSGCSTRKLLLYMPEFVRNTQKMNERKTVTIGLIDTRSEAPGILGALIGTYPTMEAAFAADAVRPNKGRHAHDTSRCRNAN
jgi:hypothetical protein